MDYDFLAGLFLVVGCLVSCLGGFGLNDPTDRFAGLSIGLMVGGLALIAIAVGVKP